MKHRKKLRLVAILLAAIAAALGVLIWILKPPPLPSLIAGNLTTGVGDACNGPMAPGVSSEFNQRLAEQFPIGTPADRLVRTLVEQGFRERPAPCRNDPTIRAAGFCGRYGWRTGPRVDVFWKSDPDDKLAMTGGAIFYVC
jgi:hypothetical protein